MEWKQVKRQSISDIKKNARLYSMVSILYQGKIIGGTIVEISTKGVKIKENTNNHTYKWKYVLNVAN